MADYLGERTVDIKDTPYAAYSRLDWVLYFVACYGGIDGAHHKAWVLDQVARAVHGAEITVKEARWSDGKTEFRVTQGDSIEYHRWVMEQRAGDDGPDTYGYDEGIAP